MLVNGGFLALLLVFPSTVLSVADDDPFLERIGNFRREDIVSLNGTFGFERFGRLVNETIKAMKLFGWLTHLLVNGTVGHCNNTIDNIQNCTVVFNEDVSGTLKQDILLLFKEMDAFHPSLGYDNFERIFSEKAMLDDDAKEMMEKPGALSDLIRLSTRFYSAWNSGATSFANKTLNDRPYFRRQISAFCYGDWKIRNPGDATRNVILALTYLMGSRCDRAGHETGEYDYIETTVYRDEYYTISDRKGFSGGDSNRCLQKFLIRFTDYDKKIYELFVDYMARYIFQTVSFYGFCLPIAFPDQNERKSWIKWAAESLEDIRLQLVDALEVFNETKSDRPFTETIDTFRRKQMNPINGSYGFERLRNVVDRTRRVMVFFGWLGSLFTNGVLGHYDEGWRREQIYVGADGSETLQQYVLALFDDVFTFNVHDIYKTPPNLDDPLLRVFYRKGEDGTERAIELARGFGGIFKGPTFIYHWIYEEVGVHFNATSSNNDTRGRSTSLAWSCREHVKTREDKPTSSNAIKALLYLLQPGCEVFTPLWVRRDGWDHLLESFQLRLYQIANTSGLTGGDSNRCLQNFVVRYAGYNKTTYEMFVDYLGKYLFQEISFYGYCLAITRADSGERKSWMDWVENGLETIHKLMSDGLNVFNEQRPPPRTTAPTNALTSGLPSNTHIALPTPTIESNKTKAVLERARDSVLPTAGMEGSMAWAQRADKHQDIANRIHQSLTATHIARYSVYFQVLVSLLQDKSHNDMQCMEIKNDRHIEGFNSHGVSYFIQYFKTADLTVGLNATWKDVLDKEAEILDAVFSWKTQDLCKSAKEEIEQAVRSKVFDVKDRFSGLAVVRCGRRFVWYQLAYRYFTVGRTAGPSFTLASGNGETYNANCVSGEKPPWRIAGLFYPIAILPFR